MTSFGYDILGFGVGGASTVILPTSTLINNLSNRSNVTTSSFLVNSGTLIIPADFWLWASSTGTAALIVDTPNATIENSGYIVGKGSASSAVGAGGNAISIPASGVTVINISGAYIAGGGGGGGQSTRNGSPGSGAGGGGQSGTPTLGAAGANGAQGPDGSGAG